MVARATTGSLPTPQGREPGGAGAAGVTPRAEASLLVGLPLSHHLGIVAGPVLTSSALDHVLIEHGHDSAAVDATLFAGLRYRR